MKVPCWPFCTTAFAALLMLEGPIASALAQGSRPDTPPPPPELQLPIACELGGGRDKCHIAFYPDHDKSEGVRDYRCGTRTYSPPDSGQGMAHTGTDFAVLDTSALTQWRDGGPRVLASAKGIVYSTRRGTRDDFDVSPLSQNACGNTVVIQHTDQWYTGYCHLQSGSISVKTNDVVEAGEVIARVGLSGNSNFPHVHFFLLHRDEKGDSTYYDPFAGTALGDADCTLPKKPFWSGKARAQMPYRPVQIVKVGFTDRRPRTSTVIRGQRNRRQLVWDKFEPIFGFAYMLGGMEGMRVQLYIVNKDGNRLAGGTRILDKTRRSELSILSLRESNTFKDYMLKAGRAPLGQLRLFVRVLDQNNKVLAEALARSDLITSGLKSTDARHPDALDGIAAYAN